MNRTGRGQIDPRRIAGYAFAAGMVLAPFLALIFGWNVGLAVMVLALAATTYLAVDALRTADAVRHPRLKLLVGINAALCLAGVAALLLSVFGDRN